MFNTIVYLECRIKEVTHNSHSNLWQQNFLLFANKVKVKNR